MAVDLRLEARPALARLGACGVNASARSNHVVRQVTFNITTVQSPGNTITVDPGRG